MAALDGERLRKLAAWETDGLPVTSLYLDVDGRRWPRRGDYVRRAEDLLRQACEEAHQADRDWYRSVCDDVERMRSVVRDGFERKGVVRGLALFSCAGAGLWEEVALPQPVRDRVVVAPRPHLLPVEAMLELAEVFCIALVDRERARIFVVSLGELEEVSHLLDDVPGQHDQGGWAQARLQRHIEDHVQRHLKHVAGTVLRLLQRRKFDHLVLAGPDEAVAELERELHDYVRRTILGRASLAMAAPAEEVLAASMDLERGLERRREREAVDRLVSELTANTGRAVAGMDDTLAALEAGRVHVLLVANGLTASGSRCARCGHPATEGETCPVCGGPMITGADLVEEAVEMALRQRCRVETVTEDQPLHDVGGIGTLLRF
jgi:peptide chain release factor subunit 1